MMDSDELRNKLVYYFHKIRITCYKSAIPLSKIIQHDEITIRPLYTKGKDKENISYLSSIDIVSPSTECLIYLSQIFSRYSINYNISYVELARDITYLSLHYANIAFDTMARSLRKKYSGGFNFNGTEREKNPEKGLYGGNALYCGTVTPVKSNEKCEMEFKITGPFKFAIYTKYNPFPCTHEEWRITRSHIIRKKTGISTIEDLLRINKLESFESLERKYLVHCEVNYIAFGLWHLGKDRCKKPSEYMIRRAELRTRLFENCYHIHTANELISHYMHLKKEIRRQLKDGKDVSPGEKRVLSLNYNRIIKTKKTA